MSADDGADWLDLDRRHVWHPYTQMATAPPPIAVARAQGAYLYTPDGRAILDAISSWWVNCHGHNHPRLNRALARQARGAGAGDLRRLHPRAGGAARRRRSPRAPPGGCRGVFFSDDGSTAVEVALKMAWQLWVNRGEAGRTLFVAFDDAYHGDTFGAMAASGVAAFHAAFAPLLFAVRRRAATPHSLARRQRLAAARGDPGARRATGRGGDRRADAPGRGRDDRPRRGVPARDPRRDRAARHPARRRRGADRLRPHRPPLRLRARADRARPPLRLEGAHRRLPAPLGDAGDGRDLRPSSPRTARRTLFHGHSYTGNALACAVGLESLAVFEEEGALARVAVLERLFAERLASLADHPRVAGVRGIGGMAALELTPEAGGGYFDRQGPDLAASRPRARRPPPTPRQHPLYPAALRGDRRRGAPDLRCDGGGSGRADLAW